MARFTEGERNLMHYMKYGTFPAPPRQYRKQKLGNDISQVVGTHYQGERKPRQMQKLPFLFSYSFEEAYPPYPPSAINIPRPLGQTSMEFGIGNSEFGINTSSTTDWVLISGLALGLLVLFGIVGFKGF